jgi:hypothetical protein
MSLFNKVAKFARSPQGRRMADQAVRAAKDPKTKRQIEHARARLMGGKRGRP